MSENPQEPFEPAIYGFPVRNPADAAHGREPLEVLASEFIDAVRQGRNPEIDAYVARNPELAGEIAELFPLLAAMEGWKAFRTRTSLEHRAISILASERFGDFRILREIGRGAMGIVFEAEEISSRLRVAVKVLPFLTTTELRERFEREAQTAARLKHPNIVPVSNFGEYDGLCYYVMQLVRGAGLDWLIQQLSGRRGVVFPHDILAQFAVGGRISQEEPSEEFGVEGPPSEKKSAAKSAGSQAGDEEDASFANGLGRDSWLLFAQIGEQIAGALEYAHARGTLHRDIKPANVLLDADGRIWLTDFGLAKETGELIEDTAAHPAGTLRYIAPEQFSGTIDVRSDIYSLGVTLFELLTRTSLFASEDRNSLVSQILQSPIPRVRDRNTWVPRDLDAVVARAMAKDPTHRYQTAKELRTDLVRFLNGQRVHARGVMGWLPFSK